MAHEPTAPADVEAQKAQMPKDGDLPAGTPVTKDELPEHGA